MAHQLDDTLLIVVIIIIDRRPRPLLLRRGDVGVGVKPVDWPPDPAEGEDYLQPAQSVARFSQDRCRWGSQAYIVGRHSFGVSVLCVLHHVANDLNKR